MSRLSKKFWDHIHWLLALVPSSYEKKKSLKEHLLLSLTKYRHTELHNTSTRLRLKTGAQ